MREENATLRQQAEAASTERAKHFEYLPAAVDFYCCGECNRRSSGYVPWPCDVVTALEER